MNFITNIIKRVGKYIAEKQLVRQSVLGKGKTKEVAKSILKTKKQIMEYEKEINKIRRLGAFVKNPVEYGVKSTLNRFYTNAKDKYILEKINNMGLTTDEELYSAYNKLNRKITVAKNIVTFNGKSLKNMYNPKSVIKREINKQINEQFKGNIQDEETYELAKKVAKDNGVVTASELSKNLTKEEIEQVGSKHLEKTKVWKDNVITFDNLINKININKNSGEYTSNLIRSLQTALDEAKITGQGDTVVVIKNIIYKVQQFANTISYETMDEYLYYLEKQGKLSQIIKIDMFSSSSEQVGSVFVRHDIIQMFDVNSSEYRQFDSVRQAGGIIEEDASKYNQEIDIAIPF